MRTFTAGKQNGIQWTLWVQIDNLDFADDLALPSHNHNQIQDKTTNLDTTSAGIGLKISEKETEVMKINTTNTASVIREAESFVCLESVLLGNVVNSRGGTGCYIQEM